MATAVFDGCAMMKSRNSFHWLAALVSSESSIKIAKPSESLLDQSATCFLSLFTVNCTSSFLIGGGAESFLPMAVMVMVDLPLTAGAGVSAARTKDAVKRAAPSNKPALRMDRFMTVLLPF